MQHMQFNGMPGGPPPMNSEVSAGWAPGNDQPIGMQHLQMAMQPQAPQHGLQPIGHIPVSMPHLQPPMQQPPMQQPPMQQHLAMQQPPQGARLPIPASAGAPASGNSAEQQSQKTDRPASSVKLFVGQIGRTSDEAEVRQLLEPYGTVLEVALIKDRVTNTSKGLSVVVKVVASLELCAGSPLTDALWTQLCLGSFVATRC